jgi:DNA (cytosine-5)-methyltransferase 1
VAKPESIGGGPGLRDSQSGEIRGDESGHGGTVSGVADTEHPVPPRGEPKQFDTTHGTGETARPNAPSQDVAGPPKPSPTDSLWSSCDWLYCRDGKWRPVEPGTFPLAHGATQRVGRLRAYGNAINAEAAKAVIQSYREMKLK